MRAFILCIALTVTGALHGPAFAQKFGQTDTRASRPSEYSEGYGEKHALVLGNFDYEHYQALPGVREDMARMEEAFDAVGFTVHVDSNLTRAGLDDKLTWFFNEFGRARSQKDNALVVYYAGHGERENYSGWLVPVSSPAKPAFEDEVSYMAWEDSLLSITELVAKTDKVKAKHVLFILDGCYLGSIINEPPGGFQPSLLRRNLMTSPSRYVLTSGPYDRRVSDKSRFTEGLFNLLMKETPQLGLHDSNRAAGGPFWTGVSLGLSLAGLDYGHDAQPQHGVFRQLQSNQAEEGGIVIEASAFSSKTEPTFDNRLVAGTRRTLSRRCAAATEAPDAESMIARLKETRSELREEYSYHNQAEWASVWTSWESCLDGLELNARQELLQELAAPFPKSGISGSTTDE